jgi:hypothetical protein
LGSQTVIFVLFLNDAKLTSDWSARENSFPSTNPEWLILSVKRNSSYAIGSRQSEQGLGEYIFTSPAPMKIIRD